MRGDTGPGAENGVTQLCRPPPPPLDTLLPSRDEEPTSGISAGLPVKKTGDEAAFLATSRANFVDWLPVLGTVMGLLHAGHVLSFAGPGDDPRLANWRAWITGLHAAQGLVAGAAAAWAWVLRARGGGSDRARHAVVLLVCASYLAFTALSAAADHAVGFGGIALVIGVVGVALAGGTSWLEQTCLYALGGASGLVAIAWLVPGADARQSAMAETAAATAMGFAGARIVSLGRWRQFQLAATVSRQAGALELANLALAEEVARRTAAEAELRDLVERDPLTGVHNRRAFTRALASLPAGAGVVLLDLDHFKSVNDRHGHPAGDRVLVALAGALQGQVRTDDVVARLGGEEFGVVLPGASAAEIGTLAEQLRAAVADLQVMGIDRPLTVSVGATLLNPGEAPELAVARADAALYQAKHAGRDRVVVAPSEG